MAINPIKLVGNWAEGYAMDVHTIRSIYLGEDQYGRPEFDNTRSEIGELVYQLKYKYKEEVVYDIIKMINPFLRRWKVINNVDLVIPVPPSKKDRKFQPVFLISEKIAESLNKPIDLELLEKIDLKQLKNLGPEEKTKAISGSILKHKKFERNVNILVIDDLYESGSTLRETCDVLRKDRYVKNIYVLTMTKTKG